MLKRTLLILTIIATGGSIVASVFYGVWNSAVYLGNIDHSIQELTKSAEARDKSVQGVQNTLVTHWQAISTANGTIQRVESAVIDLKSQVSDFEKKVTGTASQPRPTDGHH